MSKEMLKILNKEVYWKVLAKALLALLPIAVSYLWTRNAMFWNIGLVTISLGIGAERLKLGVVAISLHFLLIAICFTILFFAFLSPYIFVLTCAGMAFATIYFTRHGAQIRTLGNYTFIPAVYLTCELHEQIAPAATIATYKQFIVLMPLAWVITVMIYGSLRMLKRRPSDPSKKWGEPETLWLAPAIAIFLGVTVAASFVIFLHLSRGEWVIWSVASVITLEFASTRKKFNDRMFGAFIGVPLGILAAQFVPKVELIYSIAALGIMLTLVAFKRYRLAFGCRCFLVVFAAYIASATPTIAIERIANVFLGGTIGLIAVYVTGLILTKVSLKQNRGNI